MCEPDSVEERWGCQMYVVVFFDLVLISTAAGIAMEKIYLAIFAVH